MLSSRPQESMGAYNEQTYFQFYLLLVTTITGFTESLVSLQHTSNAKGHEYAQLVCATRVEDHQKYAQHVIQFGHLLWDNAYSQMLTHHLELLELGNFLCTPSNIHSDHMGNSAPSNGGDKDEDKDDEMAEELRHSEQDKAVTFQRWIQLLVSYWGV